ncbi:MAG: TIM barrel protein [Bacilli bacterium]|nr:TIM barrel protein [Bacilli bacterium]
MKRIGICFPERDFKKLDFEEFQKYLNDFKEAGITSFDFYTSLFLNLDEKLEKLVLFLNENDLKITFHYQSHDDHIDREDYSLVLENYKNDLYMVHNNLKKLNIEYKIPIVFHGINYIDASKKYQHKLNLINIYKELCEYTKGFNFEILIETLSYNHPKGLHIGDDLSEINTLLNKVDVDNFGICWDIGHTRLNNIETKTQLYLPSKIIDNIKFTHIHNIILDKRSNCYLEHLPFTDMDYQDEELKYLVENKYSGIYSIEFNTNDLEENILVYLNSIKLLKNCLNNLEEEIVWKK